MTDKTVILNDLVSRILYEDAYVDLTDTQITELLKEFPEDFKHFLETTEGVIHKEPARREVLNQLSLFLTDKEWPYYVDSDDYKEAWDIQMRAAMEYRNYKLRPAR